MGEKINKVIAVLSTAIAISGSIFTIFSCFRSSGKEEIVNRFTTNIDNTSIIRATNLIVNYHYEQPVELLLSNANYETGQEFFNGGHIKIHLKALIGQLKNMKNSYLQIMIMLEYSVLKVWFTNIRVIMMVQLFRCRKIFIDC